MQKSRYTYRYFECPKEVVEVYQTYAERYEPLLGRLVDRFTIVYMPDTAGEDFEAAISIRREYRTATVLISGYFLQLDERGRLEAFCHEMAHILLEPVHNEALDIISNFVPQETQKYAQNNLNKANELATDDLSRLLAEVWPRLSDDL